MAEQKKQSFLHGAALLAAATAIVMALLQNHTSIQNRRQSEKYRVLSASCVRKGSPSAFERLKMR